MRLDRRPLLATRREADLFVRRPESERIIRAVDMGLNVMITGGRGVGKTSLLQQLALQRRQAEAPAASPPEEEFVIISAGSAPGVAELLIRLLGELGDERRHDGLDPLVLLGRVASAVTATGSRWIVALDDADITLVRALFGALRDEVWGAGVSWVVTMTPELAEAALRPPVDAFFETVVPLSPLDETSGADLLVRRLAGAGIEPPFGRRHALRLARAAAGNPRTMIDFARAVVVDGVQVQDIVDRAREQEEALSGLSRGAAQLAAEMQALGPVSTSDAELQRRLGLSRPRIVQLVEELDEAGLVIATSAAPSGPGRPRTLYRLTSPTDSVPAEAGS